MNPSTSHPDLADLLPGAVDIARAAAQAIMQVYETEFAVDHKQDDSPLTLADREAHHLIVSRLRALTPAIPVLSEESDIALHDYAQRSRWSELWLVDPLDGTREFVKRNGEFTVNIALIRNHRPVLGVVMIPAAETVYYAADGLGASCSTKSGPPQAIRTHMPARRPPLVVGSRSHRSDSLDELLRRLGPHELRPVGSAVKFCRVAEGAADFYPRLGPTSEWDTAAGQAVVENAGGAVFDLQGLPLRYNRRETLLNPNFIAVGDPQFAWRSLV